MRLPTSSISPGTLEEWWIGDP